MNADQNPTTAKHPFYKGYDARLVDQTEYDNPYPDWSKEHGAWQHGWDTADFDSEKSGPSTSYEMNP